MADGRTAPATRPAAPATQPAAQAAQPEEPFVIPDAPVSTRPAIMPSDLLHFTVQDGFLVVRTKLSPTTPELQQVREMISPAYIHITNRSPVPPESEYTPDSMNINCTHREGEQIMRTSVMSVVDHLNLSRDMVIGPVEQSIQFIQSTLPSSAGAAAHLYIQSMAGENLDRKEFVAENFAAFIRKYPEQTSAYVRPMLETFGPQPQLFAVDDEIACAVLPEAFQVDTNTRAHLLQLVNDLKADDFRKRQQADAAIAAMGTRVVPILASLDRATLDPEQLIRIDALLSKLKPAFSADPKQLRNDRSFLLDCLLSQNKAVRVAAINRLHELLGKPLPLPDNAAPSVDAVYQLRRELLSQASQSQSQSESQLQTQPSTRPQ